jgi:AraC-like DNA-binding protein
MALLLDTRDVQPETRGDAVRDADALADVPRQVDRTSAPAAAPTGIEGWMFGSARLFSTDSPGLRVIRDSPTSRPEPMIALCVQYRGTGRSMESDRQQLLLPGELPMVGPTDRNEFLFSGATLALEIPFAELGIPVELAQKASTRLPASPLFPLVSQHLLALHADADLVAQSATAAEVGAATAQLVKALIVSAALDERPAPTALRDALAPRIFAYVRQHLTERDLTPVTIARAHNISVRYLYKLCDAAGVKLVDFIIAERLEGARRDLTASHRSGGTIAQVSRKWGFKDPSHFSSRFRLAYGVSPRDLQRNARREQAEQAEQAEQR